MFPDETFTGSGLTGRKLKKKAEGLALNWMQARGASGFADWDTKAGYAESLMAISHLVDLAKSEPVWELGSVLMDKIFFSIALNAYQGVLGGPQRRASAQTLKSGYVEETSGITRLMWGMGVFNSHTAGTVSLACMNKCELPPILADIAAGLSSPAELWNREQHAMGENIVNKVTYRTPDGMLSSAQDYRPGEWGEREHIWQATLGPQNVVFVTHPGNSSEKDAHAPNFWLGNAVLPRVAQWKDTLVALYNLPENDRMGFTHAYFPTVEFDEFILRGSTAFARQGSGYIALTASQGLEMVSQGRTAFRELRSYGQKAVWLCQVGREALDGDFTAFQEKVLASQMTFDGLKVNCQTLRGETLAFDWTGPLLLNGQEQPLSGYKHFENPFTSTDLPCSQMEIKTEDYLLRLDFGKSGINGNPCR